jgi:hypothetical protein
MTQRNPLKCGWPKNEVDLCRNCLEIVKEIRSGKGTDEILVIHQNLRFLELLT